MSKLDTEDRKEISGKEFAFPKQRKEPLEDAAHVRNAIARFNQVEGVTEAEKDEAWTRIKAAAKKFGVEMDESSRKELKASQVKK
jgi:cell division protein FtsX